MLSLDFRIESESILLFEIHSPSTIRESIYGRQAEETGASSLPFVLKNTR